MSDTYQHNATSQWATLREIERPRGVLSEMGTGVGDWDRGPYKTSADYPVGSGFWQILKRREAQDEKRKANKQNVT